MARHVRGGLMARCSDGSRIAPRARRATHLTSVKVRRAASNAGNGKLGRRTVDILRLNGEDGAAMYWMRSLTLDGSALP